ncbi:MAG: PorT family protein [Prevotellaceae bacterium]|jgi:hypothetical protein|nr:PorT family protein [Prevotellaceae bacterium]
MKLQVFTLCLFLSLVSAQTVQARSNNFGIKGGINFSDQSIKFNGSGINTSSYTGFHAGIFYKLDLPLFLGIQAEVLYSQKGSHYSSGNSRIKNHFDYLDIPVYLRWNLALPLVKPYAGIGPYFAFPLNKEVTGTDSFSDWEKSGYNNSDVGIGATLGVEMFDRLQVSLSYQWGLKNIYGGIYDVKAKNKNLEISVGVLIF